MRGEAERADLGSDEDLFSRHPRLLDPLSDLLLVLVRPGTVEMSVHAGKGGRWRDGAVGSHGARG